MERHYVFGKIHGMIKTRNKQEDFFFQHITPFSKIHKTGILLYYIVKKYKATINCIVHVPVND